MDGATILTTLAKLWCHQNGLKLESVEIGVKNETDSTSGNNAEMHIHDLMQIARKYRDICNIEFTGTAGSKDDKERVFVVVQDLKGNHVGIYDTWFEGHYRHQGAKDLIAHIQKLKPKTEERKLCSLA